jgi:SH3 domain
VAGMTVSSGGYSTGPVKSATAQYATAQSATAQSATAGKGQYVKAVHDFSGGQDGDLPLKQGDRVLVVRRIDANWYEGNLYLNYRQF